MRPGKNHLNFSPDKGKRMKSNSENLGFVQTRKGGVLHCLFSLLSALVLLLPALTQLSCGNSEAGVPEDDTGTVDDLTIEIDVVYPEGAVTEGFRPSVAVYTAEDYNDFSQRPGAMPIAALLGEEGENFAAGFVMNFAQSEVYIFQPGEYSVVIGVAYATGMPSHVEETPWLPLSVSLDDSGVAVNAEADDSRWRNE